MLKEAAEQQYQQQQQQQVVYSSLDDEELEQLCAYKEVIELPGKRRRGSLAAATFIPHSCTAAYRGGRTAVALDKSLEFVSGVWTHLSKSSLVCWVLD